MTAGDVATETGLGRVYEVGESVPDSGLLLLKFVEGELVNSPKSGVLLVACNCVGCLKAEVGGP